MSLAQWFRDHASLYKGPQPCNHPEPFRYVPKNDRVALEAARKKAAYAKEHMFDGLRDELAEAYADIKPNAEIMKLFKQRPARNP